MTQSISFNPSAMVNAAGSFGVQWQGITQGVAEPDPETRFALAQGFLAFSETLPMFGGVAIAEFVPPVSPGPDVSMGSQIKRATAITGGSAPIGGLAVFDQAYGMVNSPSSPVPLTYGLGQVMYYRLGSGARIAVAMAPELISAEGGLVTQNVSWDFNGNRLIPTNSTGTYALSTITWSAGVLTVVASVATPVAQIGDEVTISGATNTGTGGAAAINTSFIVNGFTDNEHFTLAAPAASGVYGTIAGSPLLVEGTGNFPCKVLRVYGSNSLIVNPPDLSGNYTWNRNGAGAVVQI